MTRSVKTHYFIPSSLKLRSSRAVGCHLTIILPGISSRTLPTAQCLIDRDQQNENSEDNDGDLGSLSQSAPPIGKRFAKHARRLPLSAHV